MQCPSSGVFIMKVSKTTLARYQVKMWTLMDNLVSQASPHKSNPQFPKEQLNLLCYLTEILLWCYYEIPCKPRVLPISLLWLTTVVNSFVDFTELLNQTFTDIPEFNTKSVTMGSSVAPTELKSYSVSSSDLWSSCNLPMDLIKTLNHMN